MMNKKTIIRTILTVLLLWFFLSQTDMSLIWDNLSEISLLLVLFIIFLHFVLTLIRSWRWHILLPKYSFKTLVQLTFIGYFYSMVLPGQIVGEGVKAYKLGKRKKDYTDVVASILVDKYVGIIALLILSCLGMVIAKPPLPQRFINGVFVFTALVVIFPFLLLIKKLFKVLQKIMKKTKKVVPRLKNLLDKIEQLMSSLRDYMFKLDRLFFVLLLCFVFQTASAVISLLLGNGFGINLNILHWLWIWGVLSIAVLLPVTIGGIGVREGTFVGLLGLFGYLPEQALALSFASFGVRLVNTVIGGLIDLKSR